MNITLHLNETSGGKKAKQKTNKQTNKKNDNNKIQGFFSDYLY